MQFYKATFSDFLPEKIALCGLDNRMTPGDPDTEWMVYLPTFTP